MKIEEVEAVQSGSWQIISIPLQVDDWENLGVGFSRQELQEINTGGLTIVPRIRSWEKATQVSLMPCWLLCRICRCLDDHF